MIIWPNGLFEWVAAFGSCVFGVWMLYNLVIWCHDPCRD